MQVAEHLGHAQALRHATQVAQGPLMIRRAIEVLVDVAEEEKSNKDERQEGFQRPRHRSWLDFSCSQLHVGGLLKLSILSFRGLSKATRRRVDLSQKPNEVD